MNLHKLILSSMFAVGLVAAPTATAAVAFFLGAEYQAQEGANAGSIRGGTPDSDPAFAAWLATAGMTRADVSSTLGAAPKAVWGKFGTPASNVTSYAYNVGGTPVTASIAGWSDIANDVAASTQAVLSTFGNNATNMQAGAPRPAFASGAGTGYYLGTDVGGSSNSDGLRNGVLFNLSMFSGGGVYSFGIFGGDLETGATNSPSGFLRLTFADNSHTDIIYAPDPTLFADVSLASSGNNLSETYGNETSRFIGFSSDDKLIVSALFVVGDDDVNDNGDSEHLSFIAPGITFLNSDGTPFQPNAVPEPSSLMGLVCGGCLVLRSRRRR